MATNETYRKGDYLSLPVPAGLKSGQPVRVGSLNGVAQTNRNEGAAPDPVTGYTYTGGNPVGNASVWLSGAFDFTVSFATTVGQPVYITAANVLTDVATSNSLFGHALTAKSATAGPLTVRLTN